MRKTLITLVLASAMTISLVGCNDGSAVSSSVSSAERMEEATDEFKYEEELESVYNEYATKIQQVVSAFIDEYNNLDIDVTTHDGHTELRDMYDIAYKMKNDLLDEALDKMDDLGDRAKDELADRIKSADGLGDFDFTLYLDWKSKIRKMAEQEWQQAEDLEDQANDAYWDNKGYGIFINGERVTTEPED